MLALGEGSYTNESIYLIGILNAINRSCSTCPVLYTKFGSGSIYHLLLPPIKIKCVILSYPGFSCRLWYCFCSWLATVKFIEIKLNRETWTFRQSLEMLTSQWKHTLNWIWLPMSKIKSSNSNQWHRKVLDHLSSKNPHMKPKLFTVRGLAE